MKKALILKEKNTYLFCMAATFVLGLIAHAYGFLHSSFSHDSLNALFASGVEEQWKIELGRFFVPVYRVVRGSVALPWLIGLIALLFLSLSVYLTVKLFDVKSKLLQCLISGIMVTNTTVTALCATYIYELDCDMLALLASVGAAYIIKVKKSVWGMLFSGACIMVSIGIYQSYLSVTITLIVLFCITELLRGNPIKEVLKTLFFGMASVLVGGIIYFGLSKIVYEMTAIIPQSRTNVFDFSGISDFLGFYKDLFFNTYRHFFDYLFKSEFYPVWIRVFSAVAFFSLLIYVLLNNIQKPLSRALTVALIVLLPFFMNITYFLARGSGVHDLMMYSICFLYIAPLIIWSGNKSFYKLLVLLSVLILWQNIILSNSAYLKKDLEAKSTLSLMTRVTARIEEREDYVPGKTPVAFVGVSELYGEIPGFENASQIVGLWENDSVAHDTVYYYYNAYDAYFKYVLNYPLNVVRDNWTMKRLKATDEVQNLTPYPDKNCMSMVDGILVVKMG